MQGASLESRSQLLLLTTSPLIIMKELVSHFPSSSRLENELHRVALGNVRGSSLSCEVSPCLTASFLQKIYRNFASAGTHSRKRGH